jgi:hypothetical protein
MQLPGFTAEISVQVTALQSRYCGVLSGSNGNSRVFLAGPCLSRCLLNGGSPLQCFFQCGSEGGDGGSRTGDGLTSAQCLMAVRGCLRGCRTLPKQQQPDCNAECYAIC